MITETDENVFGLLFEEKCCNDNDMNDDKECGPFVNIWEQDVWYESEKEEDVNEEDKNVLGKSLTDKIIPKLFIIHVQ